MGSGEMSPGVLGGDDRTVSPLGGGGHLTVLKNKNQEKGEKSEGKMHIMVWRLHLRYAHGILYVDYTALKVDS